MTATRALIILTTINYLNYIDRLILAAVLGSVKTDLSLSDFQAGFLATAFMIPYMLTSPIFGYLGDTRNRSRILAVGTGVWSVATFATGFARSFYSLIATRLALGIGESAFTTISMPYLSSFYSKEKHGRVFAIFATAAPVGAALGYLLGGVLAATVGWRSAFFIVGLPGILLAAYLWTVKEPRKAVEKNSFKLGDALKVLRSSNAYVFAVLGYCANTFVIGGVAHWIPSYMQRSYALTELSSNSIFGAMAVGAGLLGTVAGGWLSDHIGKKNAGGNQFVCAVSALLATPCFFIGISTDNFTAFVTFMALNLFFVFLSVSPINIALIESIPEKFRTTAMAMAILAIHVLGDAFSAPIIGYVSDVTGSLKTGLLICTPFLVLSGVLWIIGSRARRREVAATPSETRAAKVA